MATLERGTVVDSRFEVLELIGHGGMGVVYRARQKDIDRDVALKMLKPSLLLQPEKMKRFQREAHLAAKLDHPNIVRIFTIGLDEKLPYIAMEYLSGRHLSEVIEAEGPLPWQRALPLFMQLCDALTYAHQNHVIHRDIKPSNVVLLGDTADGATVKLVDFGIAKSLVDTGPALTETEMVLGSVFYLSPGQFEGREADPSADIYALGCTFFEVLSGTPPFVGSTVFSTIHKSAHEELPKVKNIPQSLQTLMEAMTAKSAEQRVGSADAVKRNLQAIAEGREVDPLLVAAAKPPKRKTSRKWVTVGVSATVVLAVIAFIDLSLKRLPKQSQPVQHGQLLTIDPKEKQLVDSITADFNTKAPGQLAGQYESLAEVYRTHAHQLESKYVALQGLYFLRENLRTGDAIDLFKQLACDEMVLGNVVKSTELFRRINAMEHNPVDLGVLGHELHLALILGEYKPAEEIVEWTKIKMSQPESPPGLIAIMWRLGGLALLRNDRFADATRYFAEHERRVAGNTRGEYDLLRSRLEKMLALAGAHKPLSEAEYNDVNARVAELRNVPSYADKLIAWTFSAELMIRRNHRDEGFRRARQVIEIAEQAPATMEVSEELDWARANLKVIATMLNREQQTQLNGDINRLELKMKTVRLVLNNTDGMSIPVPVPDAEKAKAL